MKDNLLLSNQLCFALYSATNTITKIYRHKLENVGLTYPQYLVMITLWEDNNLSVSAISKKLKLDSATVTPVLKRLEVNGFITRTRNIKDERVVTIALTKTGRSLESVVAKIQKEVACSTGLKQEEFIKLKNMLHQLVDAMHESIDDNKACA